ncbi:hypothetical protein [Modestobacter marinus]|uniref:hypothetical protein n=1 Tax=Modestobacter marinus TaxID=477641 RepID=UPI001C981ABD|nr:hypothetical protein [Modestobacter marinus]
MSQAWAAGASAVIVTVTAGLLAYLNSARLNRQQARLNRLAAQLGELYGPMLATLESNRRAYETFVAHYAPGRSSFFAEGVRHSEAELAAWRSWVETVFQPGNRRIHELVVTKAHLLVDDRMPDRLLDFCAHTVGYDVVLSRWKDDDFTRHTSLIPHPKGIEDYVRQSFVSLKQEQAELLRKRARR